MDKWTKEINSFHKCTLQTTYNIRGKLEDIFAFLLTAISTILSRIEIKYQCSTVEREQTMTCHLCPVLTPHPTPLYDIISSSTVKNIEVIRRVLQFFSVVFRRIEGGPSHQFLPIARRYPRFVVLFSFSVP